MFLQPILPRRVGLGEEVQVGPAGRDADDGDAQHQRLVDQPALYRAVDRGRDHQPLQRQVEGRAVQRLVAAMAHHQPAIPGEVHRQDRGVQHQVAEQAAHEAFVEAPDQLGMRAHRVDQRQHAHPHREPAGAEQGQREDLAPFPVVHAALAPDHGHPEGNRTHRARQDVGDDQGVKDQQLHCGSIQAARHSCFGRPAGLPMAAEVTMPLDTSGCKAASCGWFLSP